MMTRAEMRAAAMRLPYSSLEWLAANERAPHDQRAAARREMKRQVRREYQLKAYLLDRCVN